MGRLSNEEKNRRSLAAAGVTDATTPPGVREPIKQMTGHASEKEMAESLPDSTLTSGPEEPPKRTRRTKAEIEAARQATLPPDDPLMADPRYRKIVEKMRGKTLTTTVVKGFEVAAVATKDKQWLLDKDEEGEVDDVSYVLAKRYPILDPTNHWLSMAVYCLAVLGGLIFKRAASAQVGSWIKNLTAMFGGEEEKEEKRGSDDDKTEG